MAIEPARLHDRHLARAFTLIELLVVIAIIAVLTSILLPSLSAARDQAKAVRAMAAARSLMTSYTLYADDHRGFVLPGVIQPTTDGRVNTVVDETGRTISDPLIVTRWSYRLAPYFDYEWAGTTHVNEAEDIYERRDELRASLGTLGWQYQISVAPSFGYNRELVGGNYQTQDRFFDILTGTSTANALHPASGNVLVRIDQAFRPSHLLTFVTSRIVEPGSREVIPGGLGVQLPQKDAEYEENVALIGSGNNATPEDFGFVHARHRGRAVAAALDGSAHRLAPEALLDATRWADPAARLGDPDWRPDHPRYE